MDLIFCSLLFLLLAYNFKHSNLISFVSDDVEMEDINSKKSETDPVKTVQEKSKTKEIPEVKQKVVLLNFALF